MMDVEATKKKGETMDSSVADDWWKSIQEQVKKGRRLDELRTELRRVVGSSNNHIGTFFRRHPPSAFRPAAAATSSIPLPTRTTTTMTKTNEDDDTKQPEQRLEQIQMHVKLCVLVWAATSSLSVPKQQQQQQPDDEESSSAGSSAFIKAYAKCLRKKNKALMKQTKKTKKKQQLRLMMNDHQTDEQIVLDDLVRILQRAAFHLDPQVTLSQFLSDCIPRDCYRPSMRCLWDFFELPNPYEPPAPPAELPPLVVVKQRKAKRRLRNDEPKKATTLIETTPNQPTIHDDENENQSLLIMPDHVPLTALIRKHNSLTQRNRFVGSHFNSGLSNMDVLFRQVTVVKTKKVTTTKPPPPLLPKPTKRPPVTPRCHNNTLLINVVPPTPCATKKPPLMVLQQQQHQHAKKMASVVAEAFRSIKRRRRI
jgi:hypothetical protein